MRTAVRRVFAACMAAWALGRDFPRRSADLNATDLPVTTVEVWTDRESFHTDMATTIGRRASGDVDRTFGLTAAHFEQQGFAFVFTHYFR